MTYELSAAPDAFRIGDVFARCFRTCRRRFVSFLLVTLAVIVPIEAGVIIAIETFVDGTARGDIVALVFTPLLCLLFYAPQSVLCGSACRDMSGEPPALGRSVRDGLVRLPIVVVALIACWLAILLGWAVFAVPGIMIFTMTTVTLQACVVEKLGPFAAMSRSTALTKGSRWRILAIYLIELVVGYGLGAGVTTLAPRLLPALLAAVVTFGIQILLVGFAAVLNAAVYFELRRAKEGTPSNIAAVFD